MLAVVVVELVARGNEGLMILGIEERVGQVESVLLVGTHFLYLGLDGMELGVGGDNVGSSELLAQDSLLEPSACLVSVLRGRHISNIEGELADSGILLDLLGGDDFTFAIKIFEGEVRLVDNVEHIAHLNVACSHGDGNLATGGCALVDDLADGAVDSSDISEGILGTDHRRAVGQFEGSLKEVAEHILCSIFDAVDLERSQHGHILLGAIQNTFNDDVGKAYLLATLQVIEVDEQSADALAGSGILHLVRQVAEFLSLLTGYGRIGSVVAVGLHFSGQGDNGAVGILPCDIEQTIVGTETGGLQCHLRRSKHEAGLGLDEEADGIGLVD